MAHNKIGMEISTVDDNGSVNMELKPAEIPDASTLIVYFFSELVGTAMLLFFGCMGACVPKLLDLPTPPHFGALGFGLTVLTIIQCFGHISGAHLNPQVTLAALIMKVIRPICFPVYVTAQFVGALVGFGLLKLVIPGEYTSEGVCETHPEKHVTDFQAVVIEMILTGALILVCCSVWDSRNSHNTDSTSLRFGFIITCFSMVAGPFTGASMNTARTFAPILVNANWVHNQWIYWLGPTVGAVVGAFLYRYIFSTPRRLKLCQIF